MLTQQRQARSENGLPDTVTSVGNEECVDLGTAQITDRKAADRHPPTKLTRHRQLIADRARRIPQRLQLPPVAIDERRERAIPSWPTRHDCCLHPGPPCSSMEASARPWNYAD